MRSAIRFLFYVKMRKYRFHWLGNAFNHYLLLSGIITDVTTNVKETGSSVWTLYTRYQVCNVLIFCLVLFIKLKHSVGIPKPKFICTRIHIFWQSGNAKKLSIFLIVAVYNRPNCILRNYCPPCKLLYIRFKANYMFIFYPRMWYIYTFILEIIRIIYILCCLLCRHNIF